MSHDLKAEYAAWLSDFLPDDYYDRYDDYRWDIGLRRDHQRAAFEAFRVALEDRLKQEGKLVINADAMKRLTRSS